MLFCPNCECEARIFIAPMFLPKEHRTRIGNVVACTVCSFISEVSDRGFLIDAGDIQISDLEEPPMDPVPVTMFAAASAMRRSES